MGGGAGGCGWRGRWASVEGQVGVGGGAGGRGWRGRWAWVEGQVGVGGGAGGCGWRARCRGRCELEDKVGVGEGHGVN